MMDGAGMDGKSENLNGGGWARRRCRFVMILLLDFLFLDGSWLIWLIEIQELFHPRVLQGIPRLDPKTRDSNSRWQHTYSHAIKILCCKVESRV